jgi:SNF2 family DNA or RNA helicase
VQQMQNCMVREQLKMNPSEVLSFKRPLLAHQRAAIDRFAEERHMALLWEAGAMKTTTAIGWLRWKYRLHQDVLRTLIVSPVATLYNWRDEFVLNSPEKVHSQVLVPYKKGKRTTYSGVERAQLIKTENKRIVVLNPESFDPRNTVMLSALKEFAPQVAIVDEADGFKSYNSKRLKGLLSITDNAYYRAIMTGTPILNSYLDIWAQWRILDCGDALGTSFFAFRERYFEDKNVKWKGKPKYFPDYRPKEGIENEIAKILERKASRKKKSECLDLPPQVFEIDRVELSPDQEKAYRQMEEEMLAQIRDGTCAAVNALSQVNRLLQILAGFLPVQGDDSGEKSLALFHDTPRIQRLRYRLEQLIPEHKVIVWATFSASYVLIRSLFRELDIEFSEITGESKDHHGEKERFQTDPKCRAMLANPQAGGIGINLQQASYSIYYSRNYSLRQREQSLARNYRGGSEIHEQITVIDIVAQGTLDEDVLAALLRKQQFSDNILTRLNHRDPDPLGPALVEAQTIGDKNGKEN